MEAALARLQAASERLNPPASIDPQREAAFQELRAEVTASIALLDTVLEAGDGSHG